MKISKKMIQKIKKEVGENQKKFFMPFKSSWSNDFVQSVIEVEDGGRLAVQISKLGISFKTKDIPHQDLLKTLSKKIAEKVTYLQETFKVIEIDIVNSQALLASEKPIDIKGIPEYFQLKVNASLELTLQRIRNIDHKNDVISFVLSYDILERFLQDCIDIVTEIVEMV